MVEWDGIDTVLLDMDGTLLDLRFDNHFWLEHVPQVYAEARGITFEESCATLFPRMQAIRGTLDWYCVEFWSRELSLDIIAMKTALAGNIRVRPGAREFLAAVRASGRRLYLLTNAHPRSLEIKLDRSGIGKYFDVTVSSHELGAPKEHAAFWTALRTRHGLDPVRCLFVDDTVTVLEAARLFGVGAVLAVRQPDSTGPAADRPGFDALDHFEHLLPIPDLVP